MKQIKQIFLEGASPALIFVWFFAISGTLPSLYMGQSIQE